MKGALSSMEPEIKHGFFTIYDTTGVVIFKGSYKNDKLEGRVYRYLPGSGRPVRQLTYVNDIANGPGVMYDTTTGMISSTGEIVNFLRDGEWVFRHYKSDKIFASYYFTNGYRNGYFARFYKSGNKMAEGFYSGNRAIGEVVYYYDKPGVVEQKITFEYGLAEGVTNVYDSATGKIILTGNYKNGNRNGKWEYFYSDGKKKGFETYKDDELNGESEYFYPSGKVREWGYYKFNKPSGKHVSYYDDGQIKDIEEFDGSQAYGVYIYYDSVSRKPLIKGEAIGNQKIGLWYYYEKGTDVVTGKCHYKDGKEDGDVFLYYDDGTKKMTGQYSNGSRVGEWNYYHKGSGAQWIKCKYSTGGVLDGDLLVYHENGGIKRQGAYVNDTLISSNCFDEYGHIVKCEKFYSDAAFDGEVSTFIGNELKYPEVSRIQGVEGKVMVRFTVNEDGTIAEPYVTQSLNPECDREAIRIIMSMPKWKPAQIDGQTFKTQKSLPIVFWIPEKAEG
jgi:TonB family protein